MSIKWHILPWHFSTSKQPLHRIRMPSNQRTQPRTHQSNNKMECSYFPSIDGILSVIIIKFREWISGVMKQKNVANIYGMNVNLEKPFIVQVDQSRINAGQYDISPPK